MSENNNQEDLAMEDILSSIKNILMEDNVSQQEIEKDIEDDIPTMEAPEVVAPSFADAVVDEAFEDVDAIIAEEDITPLELGDDNANANDDVLDIPAIEVEPEAEEDVFDLSEAMMLGDIIQNQDVVSQEAPVVEPIFEEPAAVEEAPLVLDEESEPIFDEDNADVDVDFDIDSELAQFDLSEQIEENHDLAEIDLNSFEIGVADEESEPIFDEAPSPAIDFDLSALVDEDTPAIEDIQVEETYEESNETHFEPVEFAEPELKTADFYSPRKEEPKPVVEEPRIIVEEQKPVISDFEHNDFASDYVADSQEDDEKLEIVDEEEVAAVQASNDVESTKEDAADISASIINNFAKMFASQKQEKEEKIETAPLKVEAPKMAPVALGNTSKTLEDMVKEVIEDAVCQQVQETLDVAPIAKEIIADQTKAWLDKNLPSMVEAIVKKEIERVMAKVGS